MPEKMHHVTANKLLKLIEEPPIGTYILMISEHYEHLLPTITSRTQIIKNKPNENKRKQTPGACTLPLRTVGQNAIPPRDSDNNPGTTVAAGPHSTNGVVGSGRRRGRDQDHGGRVGGRGRRPGQRQRQRHRRR